MKSYFQTLNCLALCLTLGLVQGQTTTSPSSTSDLAAMAECGNLHRLDFHLIPNAAAHYINDQCSLRCAVGAQTLSQDALNEGYLCPGNPNGYCHSGTCVVNAQTAVDQAIRECGNLHHIDFKNAHSRGTQYLNSQCFLKCALNNAYISSEAVNEGFPCPADAQGTCHSGQCVRNPSTGTTVNPHGSTDKPLTLRDIHLRIRGASLNHSLPNLVAAACVELTQLDFNHHRGTCAGQVCETPVIATNTDKPNFNSFNCHVGARSISDQSYLMVALYQVETHGRTKQYIPVGYFDRQLHQIITAKDPKDPHQFPILNQANQTIGEFDLGIDFA